MNHFRFLFIILFCFAGSVSYSQQSAVSINSSGSIKELGIELDPEQIIGEYGAVPVKNDRVILYYQKQTKSKDSAEFEFVQLDKEMNEQYRLLKKLPRYSCVMQTVTDGQVVYFLAGIVHGENIFGYTLAWLNTDTREIAAFNGNMGSGGRKLNSLSIKNGVVYVHVFKGIGVSAKPEVIVISPGKGTAVVTALTNAKEPAAYKSGVDIADECIVGNYIKKSNKTWLAGVTSDGKLRDRVGIQLPEGKYLSDARIAELPGKKIFVGQYGIEHDNMPSRLSIFTTYTEGICLGILKDTTIEKLNLIPYHMIRSLRCDTMNTRKDQKNLRVHFSKPLITDKEIILVGEMYEAFYKLVGYRDPYQFNYKTHTYETNYKKASAGKRVFDNWKFLSVVVLKFNFNGELIYENTVLHPRSNSRNIYDRVSLVPGEPGHAVFAFYMGYTELQSCELTSENEIREYAHKLRGTIEGDELNPLSDDKKETERLTHFFDNYYLAQGVVKFKNKTSEETRRNRVVYYLKRVRL